MIKYFCDKCGKEVPKEEIKQCSLYVRKFRASLKEIELSYCTGICAVAFLMMLVCYAMPPLPV